MCRVLLTALCLFCSPAAFAQEILSYPYQPPQHCVWRYGPVDQLVEVTLIDSCGRVRHEHYWRRVNKWYQHCGPCHRLHILDGANDERFRDRGVVIGDEPVEQRRSVVRRKR